MDTIKFMDCYKEIWHSGAREGYSGVDYYINIIVNTKQEIQFDSIWVENKVSKLKTLKNNEILKPNEQILKQDTLMLRCTFLENSNNTSIVKPIVKINNNQALIKIRVNKEEKYFVTPIIQEKKRALRQ